MQAVEVAFIHPQPQRAEEYLRALEPALPGLTLRVWPDIPDPAAIDVALVWQPPPGALAALPRLELIVNLGMGVDYLLRAPDLPRGVPIARLVDPNMVEQMCEYVLCCVLYYHRRFDVYQRMQAQSRWHELPLPHTHLRRVGVLGLGAIGGFIARRLAEIGFDVAGWSHSPKSIERVASFAGSGQLTAFLNRTEILTCVLPLTPATTGTIDATALAALPRGAYVINIARGQHVVEEDLLAALESGHIAGATLDVVRREPLPAGSPLWTHPAVRITPHIAGLTNPATAAPQIADNIARVRAGKPPLNVVDPARGY